MVLCHPLNIFWVCISCADLVNDGAAESEACCYDKHLELKSPKTRSHAQELVESSNLVPFGHHAGNIQVGLALQPTQFVALGRPLLQPVYRPRVENADTTEVEAHVDGHVVVDGQPHDDEIVQNMTILGKDVKERPPSHRLVDHEWPEVPSLFVMIKQSIFIKRWSLPSRMLVLILFIGLS